MASASWVIGTLPPTVNFGTATFYISLTGTNDGEDQVHSQTRVPAGQFSALFATGVSITGTATLTSNKNNAAGNQSISVTGAGQFQDNTHTDSVANGDKFCTKIVGATFTEIGPVGYLFDTSFNSGVSKATNWLGQGSQSSGNNGGGYFGGGLYGGAENDSQVKFFSAGTLSNIQVWETNGFQTFVSRLNGVTGNLTVLASGGTWADDNTHSDTVSANDLIAYSVNATSTERTYGEAIRFVSNDGGYELSCAWTASGNINSNTFACPSVNAVNGNTEVKVQTPAVYQCKLTELSVRVYAAGGTGTVKIRKGGANGTGSIAWSTTQGTYRDTVSSDTFNVNDLLAFEALPNSASNLAHTDVHVAPGVSTETANVTMALSGVSFSIAASDPSFANKHVVMALSGVSFSGAANRRETGAATITLGGVAFSAHASRLETGAVNFALHGISIQATGFDLNALSPARQFTTFG